MNRKFAMLTLIFLLLLFGLASQSYSRDLLSSDLRLQLSDEEIKIRKEKNLETIKLRLVESDGVSQMTYDEWKANQGTPLPYSSKLVRTGASLRADSKIIVLVNSDLYPLIETSITQYVADLVAEGYSVEVHAMIGGTPYDIRDFLQAQYALGMDGALFVGDLPIAWYEDNCDLKARASEQFPCDYYYMDLDGNFYDDNANGLFEYHDGNVHPEIYVGRLTASTLTYNGSDEVNLVINYFRKNHLFRTGQMNINNRALAFIDDDWQYSGPWIEDCLEFQYCQSILYDDPAQTVASNYIAELSEGHEFVHVATHSNPAGNWFGNTSLMYNQLYELDPPCIFYTLFACSNSRFTTVNYMGGWYIFNDNYGLAATGTTKTGSMLNFDQFYYPIGQGATIGEAYYLWWHDMASWGLDEYYVCWFYGNVLLGDPTLKPSERKPVELQEAVLPYCLKNRNYSFYLDADGGFAPPYGWEMIDGQLPNGVTLDLTTGHISGQPTESGLFNFTVSAEDLCVPGPMDYDPVFGDTLEYSFGVIGICGDANNSGLSDIDDVTDIIDYLFNDGTNMAPVAAGNMDQFVGTNINDAYYLYEYVTHYSVYPKCPPFTATIPSAPENVLELRNTTVQPDRDLHRVDFWINSSLPAKSLSIPFEYSCATSPITCESISFAGSSYSHYAEKHSKIDGTEPKAVIGIANTGETAPSDTPARIGSAWFRITPSTEEQEIIITSTAYGPNEFIIIAPSPTAPYIPSLAVIPGFVFECGDASDDGAINILDIIFLINYKYKTGPEPSILGAADVNSDSNIDILDIVYLINFLYKDGADPDCL